MKTVFFALCLLLSLAFACKKKSGDDVSPASDVYVRANIDGKPFSIGAVPGPGSTTGSYANFSISENRLFINGTGTTVYLIMTVQDFPKKTGTFPLNDASSTKSGGTYVDATDPKNGVFYLTQNGRTGTVTISSFDGKTMSGTFSYTTYSKQTNKEVKITNGEFKVPYNEF
jgi:hypothetical protein